MEIFYKKDIILVFVLVFFLFSCKENNPEKPNIVFIVSEDNGLDLGCYGNEYVHTPHIDRLASKGTKFTNAYTTYALCSPSRSSIFTGLYPHQNGQMGLATHAFTMYDSFRTLPDFLDEAGYTTGCLGKIHVNPEDLFSFDYRSVPGSNFGKKNLESYANETRKFVESNEENPFFLMINLPDAHVPFQNEVDGLPTVKVDRDKVKNGLPFVGVNTGRLQDVTTAYYNCINRLDESVGMIMKVIEEIPNTLIIYISDHGAQFSRGKKTNYEGGLRIPFIVSWPEQFGEVPETRDELISVVDILPTILEAAGEKTPEHLPGMSLLPVMRETPFNHWRQYLGADGGVSSPALCYPARSIRGGKYKIIHNLLSERQSPLYKQYEDTSIYYGCNAAEIDAAPDYIRKVYAIWKNPPEWELYDLENDPWEFRNLSDRVEYENVLKEMQVILHSWREDTDDPLLDSVKLEKYISEMDSVNQLYPDQSYKKDPHFSLRYPRYLF